jgi:transitional endoplasmic reticulum ATPase
MLRDLREWIELRAAIIAIIILRFAAIYWLVVLGAKFFTREPLLYQYSLAAYTQETIPVAAALIVQITCFMYQILTRSAWGRGMDSFVLHSMSPKIAALSIVAFWMWSESNPAPGASHVPLAVLAVISTVSAIAVRWGPLARDSVSGRTSAALDLQRNESSAPVARASTPRMTFADIHGNHELKRRLLLAGKMVMQPRKKNTSQPARNGILLHGEPGNGKTVFAEALAGELGFPLLTLSYSAVATKWVGEKTSRVRAAFEDALRQQPCVLFVDEVDSFLEARDASGPGTMKEDRDLVNALLTLIVDIRQSRVLLIAATNHLDRLDAAAIREGRFDFKIQVPPPDQEARLGLLVEGLKTSLPHARVPTGVLEAVARRWNGFSSKRILAVTEELPNVMSGAERRTPDFADFVIALRAVQGHAINTLENVRPLSDLILSDRTRRGLGNVLARMADPESTERHGGTLPTGVIFFGPPGTGKTAAAKALATELGWTFLAATGGELSRGVEPLNRIYAKARDLRPAIVFIDEADELLRDRSFSAATDATNKLLTIMDGVGDRVPDVVWIAATNHLEQLDSAMLRGGRFSEKVEFELASREALVNHVMDWLHARLIQLEPSLQPVEIIDMFGEVSIANAEAVIQAAVNLAIARGVRPVIVTRQDVWNAIDLVMGEEQPQARPPPNRAPGVDLHPSPTGDSAWTWPQNCCPGLALHGLYLAYRGGHGRAWIRHKHWLSQVPDTEGR